MFLLLATLFLACGKERPAAVRPAFYHWQTHLQLSENERLAMDSLGARKLYVKFFDVDWDEAAQRPVPLAEVEIDTQHLHGLEIVPTVFITNRTFEHLPQTEVGGLAERVWEKISFQFSVLSRQHRRDESSAREIQIDCDWAVSTREKYFKFLEHLHSKLKTQNSKLSSTIRLHQFKYPEKTGVPPVDRGMLMAYNMGDLGKWETENSILDLETLDQYLGQSSVLSPQYPVPLDLALPLFRWGVVFRDGLSAGEAGELAHLLNDLGPADLQDTLRFAELATNRFEVRENTYLDGYFLYAGDRVRLEGVSPELLAAAVARPARFLKPGRSESTFTVAFYHLDTSTLKFFDHGKLEKVLEKF